MTTYPSSITAALNAVMSEVSHAAKDGENTFHKYKYTSEQSLLDALRKSVVNHGLMLLPSISRDNPPMVDDHGNTHIVVDYTLAHKSGDVWPEKISVPGCGNDKSKDGKVGDKGVYKAMTGANKYLLFKLFQIASGDDPEHERAEKEAKKAPMSTKPLAAPPPPESYVNGMDPGAGWETIQRAFDADGTITPKAAKMTDSQYWNTLNKFGAQFFGSPNWFPQYMGVKHEEWMAPDNGINYGALPPKYLPQLMAKFYRAAKQWRKVYGNWPEAYPSIIEAVGIEKWLDLKDDDFAEILSTGKYAVLP